MFIRNFPLFQISNDDNNLHITAYSTAWVDQPSNKKRDVV